MARDGSLDGQPGLYCPGGDGTIISLLHIVLGGGAGRNPVPSGDRPRPTSTADRPHSLRGPAAPARGGGASGAREGSRWDRPRPPARTLLPGIHVTVDRTGATIARRPEACAPACTRPSRSPSSWQSSGGSTCRCCTAGPAAASTALRSRGRSTGRRKCPAFPPFAPVRAYAETPMASTLMIFRIEEQAHDRHRRPDPRPHGSASR